MIFERYERQYQQLQGVKIVLRISNCWSNKGLGCDAETMPLLSGGLGALGVVTATFLVEDREIWGISGLKDLVGLESDVYEQTIMKRHIIIENI